MVVMHQLQQKNISWDAFIANDVFTTPPSHHEQDIPSSSHPPITSSPSHPTTHAPPSTHIPSPHDDPSTTLHPHIMITKHQEMMGTLRPMALN